MAYKPDNVIQAAAMIVLAQTMTSDKFIADEKKAEAKVFLKDTINDLFETDPAIAEAGHAFLKGLLELVNEVAEMQKENDAEEREHA